MTTASETCEFVLDPEAPKDSHHGGASDVDPRDGASDADGGWSCPNSPERGEALCLFHLPPDEKDDRNVESAFFDAVDESRGGQSDDPQDVGLVGAKFGELVCADRQLTAPDIDLRYARFDGDVELVDCDVAGRLSLRGATFESECAFDGTAFKTDVGFEGATFGGDVSFRNITFWERNSLDTIDFSSARFRRNVSFADAGFYGPARFSGVAFEGDATFSNATFDSAAYFDDAAFSADAYFDRADFDSRTDWSEAFIRGNADFSDADFGAGRGIRSSGQTTFAGFRIEGTADFSNAVFGSDADPDTITVAGGRRSDGQ